MHKYKKDLILILLILVIASIGFFINHTIHKQPAAIVEISVDGKVTESYPLNQDLDIILQGYGTGTNHLIIQDNHAWITEATCPDKVCIHQGKIQENGQMLVCLPNRLIVQIKTSKSN